MHDDRHGKLPRFRATSRRRLIQTPPLAADPFKGHTCDRGAPPHRSVRLGLRRCARRGAEASPPRPSTLRARDRVRLHQPVASPRCRIIILSPVPRVSMMIAAGLLAATARARALSCRLHRPGKRSRPRGKWPAPTVRWLDRQACQQHMRALSRRATGWAARRAHRGHGTSAIRAGAGRLTSRFR